LELTDDTGLEHAVKTHTQWFGSYKKSSELVKVQVWLTVNDGNIEFLTARTKLSACARTRASSAISAVKTAPPFRAPLKLSWEATPLGVSIAHTGKTHPFVMTVIALLNRRRIKTHKQVLVRVCPDEPNLMGVTDPVV
jgi:hypothetical protein